MKIELDEFCPCCDYDTLEKAERLNYEVCLICFWEDEPLQFEEPTYKGGSNGVSLIEARKNFAIFGACKKEMIKNGRKPNENDKRKSLSATSTIFITTKKSNIS